MELRPKAKWTFAEIDELRQQLQMSWKEFANAVGLSEKYLTIHLKRNAEDPTKYQPPGRDATNRINTFVETLMTTPTHAPPTNNKVTQRYGDTASLLSLIEPDETLRTLIQRLVEYMYALARVSPPNDAVTYNIGIQYSGHFLVRRTFTRCPKCRHVDEQVFKFRSAKDAEVAYEKAREWLEHEDVTTVIAGYS